MANKQEDCLPTAGVINVCLNGPLAANGLLVWSHTHEQKNSIMSLSLSCPPISNFNLSRKHQPMLSDLFSSIWLQQLMPLWMTISVIGCGSATSLIKGLRFKRPSLAGYGFISLFALTLFGLTFNFFYPLGLRPGLFVLGIGSVLYCRLLFIHPRFFTQTGIIVLLNGMLAFKIGFPFGHTAIELLHYDTGLYHMQFMEWVAREPLPLGLVNLSSRLGFDSAWLVTQSMLRIDPWLGWSHLAFLDVTCRVLVLAWMVESLIDLLGQSRAFSFLAMCFAVILTYITEMPLTTTDMPSNLLGFAGWSIYLSSTLQREQGDLQYEQWILSILILALAATFKLSMLGWFILLIPMIRLAIASNRVPRAKINLAFCVAALYLVIWVIRNTFLTGCLIYPVNLTCLPLPWTAGIDDLINIKQGILSWARFHGSAEPPNGEWVIAWFNHWLIRDSKEFLFLLMAIPLFLATIALSIGTLESRRITASNGLLFSFIAIGAGFTVWLFSGPDLRFSWSYFAALAVLSLNGYFRLTAGGDFFDKSPQKTKTAYRLTLVALAILVGLGSLLSITPNALKPPLTELGNPLTAGIFTVVHPTKGDQCWEALFCSPTAVQGLLIERIGDRLMMKKSGEIPK